MGLDKVKVYKDGRTERRTNRGMSVIKLTDTAKLPRRGNENDLGYDIFSDEDVVIQAGERVLIGTGLKIQLDPGFGFLIKDRSSYAASKELETSAGVVDPGYVGEVKVVIRNHGKGDFQIEQGDKIAQIVPIRQYDFEVNEVSAFRETMRGSSGFGSTGNK